MACLLAAQGKADLVSQKSVSLFAHQGKRQTTVLWPKTSAMHVIGIVITNEEIWTFMIDKRDLKHPGKSMPNEQTLFYRESKAFQEEISKPLFESDEWARHKSNVREAILISSGEKKIAPVGGFAGAVAQEMKIATGVEKVQWKEVATFEESDLILNEFRDRQYGEFRIERGHAVRGSGIFFEGQITTQNDHWERRLVENDKIKTPDFFKKEQANGLTEVQGLCDGVSASQRFPLSHDSCKWEPSDDLITFQWPGGAGRLPSVVYHNDDNANPNDITIVVATDESAWVLTLPQRLVLFTVDQFNLHTNTQSLDLRGDPWYQENIGKKVQGMWEEVIRPSGNGVGLHGRLARIAILSRADEYNRFERLPNKKLIEAVLADMWVVSDDPGAEVKGPLQGRDPINIPWFGFHSETRLRLEPEAKFVERLMAPQHYFAVESKSQSELLDGGSGRRERSLLRLFYGGQVVFSGEVSREFQGEDLVEDGELVLKSPKSKAFGVLPFQPPSPCDVMDTAQ